MTVATPAWSQSIHTDGNVETDAQLVSKVATGTAPLAVSSTTMVPSLNADQVDGLEGTALALDSDLQNVETMLVALQTLLETDDVAVSMTAVHYCVKARGVMDATSETTTTALGGVFKTQPDTRREFLMTIS